ncbi:MAG: prepilin-type N-terminal cleavage/methylation domain-containing protein [Yoonia sp.]|uniref:PulJ/GspJ family protein n=1 Tax=Yoonia sp. TaxID=2212373 RepID=UPI00273FFCEF|nr:prepilin-type N-terminal cleavage/methylation domain-containing protein [Yoonia sp.]MDP5086678.1 prepilin-type N-terminal cleavage/methylation domain-containing protein [Yoonia sp.]
MKRSGGQRGFTLIETLVSLAIAAIAVTGFYQALSQGLFMEQRATIQAEQMLVATQIMDRVGVDIPVRAGIQDNGTAQGLAWSYVVSESGTADMDLGRIRANELLYIYVTVGSDRPDGSPLVLRGIRYVETPL